MRHRNLNAEIADLVAALTAPVRGMDRAAPAAKQLDHALRAPPEPGREVTGAAWRHERTDVLAS